MCQCCPIHPDDGTSWEWQDIAGQKPAPILPRSTPLEALEVTKIYSTPDCCHLTRL